MKIRIKRLFQLLYKKFYNMVYLISREKEIKNNKVVFVISRANKIEGNLKLIYEEITATYPNLKIHFVKAENKMNLKLFRELIIIKDAKYIILDDYYLPIYLLNIKTDVKVIQVWHAAGAFKKFGYSTVGTMFGPTQEYLDIVPIHSNYTHVYVSAEYVKPYYAEAFNMNKTKIFAYGIPRSEIVLSDKMQKKKTMLDQLQIKNEQKVIVLWAPTYRADGAYAESDLSILDEIKYVMENISNQIIILYKPHPYSKLDMEKLINYSNLIIVNNQNINELMILADALITDYSSVIFEYSLLKRPFAHYVPDLEEYTKNRGFYEPIETVSEGIIIKKIEVLIKWISERKKSEDFETSKMIAYNFSNLKEPTKKIVNHFIDEKEVR